MSNGIGSRPGPHGRSSAISVADRRGSGVGHGILANSSGAGSRRDRARALPPGTRPWAATRSRSHVQLLLVAKQKITAGKASCALRAFEWLLLGVRSFVPLKMFQPSK